MNRFELLDSSEQAGVCEYVIDCLGCHEKVDYTEQVFREVLCRRIADPDIKLKLLGHTNQDMTLGKIFHFIETKETGKRSATRLFNNQSAAIKTTYARNKKLDIEFTDSNNTEKKNGK